MRNVTIFPDLLCMAASSNLLQELDRLLHLKSTEPVTLFYDTTFNIGDFYVSPLTVKHMLFKNNPSIPVAFLIHERKYQRHHELFFETLSELVPSLRKCTAVLVTDREKGITNAIHKVLPGISIVLCWNHLKQDIRYWIKKHGGKSDEISIYAEHLNTLLNCETEEIFQKIFSNLSTTWTSSYLEYFNREIKPSIINHSGRWVLERFNIYNPFSGITNNVSESINRVLKDLTCWKCQPVDCALLSFWHLQRYFQMEIYRGKADVGQYHLKSSFINCCIASDEIPTMGNILTPENIVKFIRTSAIENTVVKSQSQYHNNSQLKHVVPANATISTESECLDNTEGKLPQKLSQLSLAKAILQDKGVVHIPELECFIVKGSQDSRYAVKLFPKATCQCPSTSECYHILAAKLSIGLSMEQSQSAKINLTQLRRNSKKRLDKKSGRKQPRLFDYHPAPDSQLCISALSTLQADDEDTLSSTSVNLNKNLNKKATVATPEINTPSCNVKKRVTSDTDSVGTNNYLGQTTKNASSVNQNDPTKAKVKPTNNSSPTNNLETTSSVNQNGTTKAMVKPASNSTPTNNLETTSSANQNGTTKATVKPTNNSGPTKNLETTSSVNQNSTTKPPVKHTLKLVKTQSFKDKLSKEILGNQEITSDILDLVNNILVSQFPNIKGFQSTLLAPILIAKCWHYACQLEARAAPTAQIHHTGVGHWVAYLQRKGGKVHVLDSMIKNNISPSLQMQLACLYGSGVQNLGVFVPHIQQQMPGTVDCGVFAVANVVEYCINGYNELELHSRSWDFDMPNCRKHLVSCLESKKFVTFPKIPLLNAIKMDTDKFSIPLLCPCGLPDIFGDMVACDRCGKWHHQRCCKSPFNANEAWFCNLCQAKRPTKTPSKYE